MKSLSTIFFFLITVAMTGICQYNKLIPVSSNLGIRGYYFTNVVEGNKGHIWAGTDNNGLIKIIGDETLHFKHDINDSNSISSGFIHSLDRDEKDRLWVGTRTGLNLICPPHDSVVSISFPLKTFSPFCPRVYTHIPDGNNGYWIGSGCGLLHVDSNLKLITQYPIKPHYKESEYNENVLYSLKQDIYNPEIIWVGTRYGFKSFNKKTKQFSVYKNPDKWHNLFPSVQQYGIMDFVQTAPDTLWLAALWSGGILRFNPKTNQWHQFLFPNSTKEKPRSGNLMHSLIQFNDSLLLFGNNIGFGFFNMNNTAFEPLNQVKYGTDQNYFNQYLDRFGHVWIAGISGLYKSSKSIRMDHSHQVSPPEPQFINASSRDRHLDLSNTLELSVDSNDLHIKLYSPNYPFSLDDNIRYKLVGQDKTWSKYSSQNQIRYNNLPAGKYKLKYEVREQSRKTEWLKGETLTIKISQPFYLSIYFILSAVALSGLMIYFIVNKRIKMIRASEQLKSDQERQLLKIKMSALNSQMNPHFLFNTMNSINHYILKNESDKASHYLTRFSRLIRQVLHNSRQSLVSLEDELNAMSLYIEMEKLRFDNGFEYNLHVDGEIDVEATKLPPMLFQPYIENAIWHGLLHKDNDRKLIILIDKFDDNLIISVRDNGIGRAAAESYKSDYNEKRKSVGMSITKDRILLANKLYRTDAAIEIIDHEQAGKSTGTEIILTIPLINGHEKTAHS